MKWKGRRGSSNVQDARGRRVVTGGAALGSVINLIVRVFGIKGILALVVLGFVGWQMGLLDPAMLLGGSQVKEVSYEPSPEEEERFQFVQVVLADTEDIWSREFNRIGGQYREPELVVYVGQYPTGCGLGDAQYIIAQRQTQWRH